MCKTYFTFLDFLSLPINLTQFGYLGNEGICLIIAKHTIHPTTLSE